VTWRGAAPVVSWARARWERSAVDTRLRARRRWRERIFIWVSKFGVFCSWGDGGEFRDFLPGERFGKVFVGGRCPNFELRRNERLRDCEKIEIT
jgi:hypothetical protein